MYTSTTNRGRRGKAASNVTSSGSMLFLRNLLNALRKVRRSDKSRTTVLLQALLDSKFLLPPSSQPQPQPHNHDVNLIIVATHIINRIITTYTSSSSSQQEQEVDEAALLLARMAYDLSQILLSDKMKLERVANMSLIPHARSLLGRTFISIVLGSLTSLELLSKKSTACTNEVKNALWESLVALESVIKFTKGGINTTSVTLHTATASAGHTTTSTTNTATTNKAMDPPPPHASSSNSHTNISSSYPTMKHAIHDIPVQGETWWKHVAKKFVTSLENDYSHFHWQEVSKSIFSSAEGEEETLNALLNEASTNEEDETHDNSNNSSTASTSPAKRKRTSPGSSNKSKKAEKPVVENTPPHHGGGTVSSSCPLNNAAVLLYSDKYPANNVSIDGRLTMRRLASMMIVWFQGQNKILRTSIRILQHFHIWEKILHLDTTATTISTTTDTCDDESLVKTHHPKKKSKKSTNTNKKGTTTSIMHSTTCNDKHDKPHLPGNVCVVTFVARLIDLVADSSNICGSRQPIVGIETYTRLILGGTMITTTSKSTTTVAKSPPSSSGETVAASLSRQLSLGNNKNQPAARRTRSSARAALSSTIEKTQISSNDDMDISTPIQKCSNHLVIRNMITAVITLLLQAHHKCIHDNYVMNVVRIIHSPDDKISAELTRGATMKESVLPSIHPFQKNLERVFHVMLNNNDSSSMFNPIGNSRGSDFAPIYPLLHRTIATLARNASSFSTDNEATNSRDIVLGIGCSLAFKYGSAEHSFTYENKPALIYVADSKLISMAINHLSDSLGKVICSSKNLNCDTKEDNEKSVKGDHESKASPPIQHSLINDFALNKAIVPDLREISMESGFDGRDYLGTLAISTINDESKVSIQSNGSSPSSEEIFDSFLGNDTNAENSSTPKVEVLALFLRALMDEEGENCTTDPEVILSSTKKFISKLLLLLLGCYTVADRQETSPTFVPRLVDFLYFSRLD